MWQGFACLRRAKGKQILEFGIKNHIHYGIEHHSPRAPWLAEGWGHASGIREAHQFLITIFWKNPPISAHIQVPNLS